MGWVFASILVTSALGRLAGESPTPAWTFLAVLGVGEVGCWLAGRSLGSRRSKVVVDGGALRILRGSSERRIERAAIEGAMVVRRGERAHLQLSLAGEAPLVIDLASEDEANEVVEQLALDGTRNRTHLRLASEGARITAYVAGGFFGGFLGAVAGFFTAALAIAVSKSPPFGIAVGAAVALFFMWGGGWVLSRMLPEITIGADGIAFKNGSSSKTQFVPYEQFAGVTLNHVGMRGREYVIELSLEGGDKHAIAGFDKSRSGEATAIVRRIDRAWKAWSEAGSLARVASSLETGAETTSDWLADLRKLAREQAGYRATTITTEQLLTVMENPAAPVKHRIGAAVVLGARGDTNARERIRIAAGASANEKLSAAFGAVAAQELEEDAIAEAVGAELAKR